MSYMYMYTYIHIHIYVYIYIYTYGHVFTCRFEAPMSRSPDFGCFHKLGVLKNKVPTILWGLQ